MADKPKAETGARILRSGLTDRFYVATRWIDRGDGNVEALRKFDVTEQVEEIVRDLEHRLRQANAAVVLAQDVLAEALRRRSWAYVEGFVGSTGKEPVGFEEWERVVDVNYPGAAVEEVGDREELVIYTGRRVEEGFVRRLTDEEVADG